MTNKLYDSKGQLIGYIRTVEKNLHDDLTRVILSTGHELVFGPCDLTSESRRQLAYPFWRALSSV